MARPPQKTAHCQSGSSPVGACAAPETKPFQVPLAQALARLTPDRLLLEPTGLAETGRLLDIIRQPPFSSLVDLRTTLTLVDPRHFSNPRIYRRKDWRSRLEAADVLIADRCDDDDLKAFLSDAAELYPPKSRS